RHNRAAWNNVDRETEVVRHVEGKVQRGKTAENRVEAALGDGECLTLAPEWRRANYVRVVDPELKEVDPVGNQISGAVGEHPLIAHRLGHRRKRRSRDGQQQNEKDRQALHCMTSLSNESRMPGGEREARGLKS